VLEHLAVLHDDDYRALPGGDVGHIRITKPIFLAIN
jgi:hypothetical protein